MIFSLPILVWRYTGGHELHLVNWKSIYKFILLLGYIFNKLYLFFTPQTMKAKISFLITLLLFSTSFIVFAQSGMTIRSGGAITVNGNLSITPPAFTCGTPLTDTRDGKIYNTVLIGTQCWFVQNLNIGTKFIGSANQTNNGIIEKYCYNNDDANCAIYGGLYQWDEAMQYVTT